MVGTAQARLCPPPYDAITKLTEQRHQRVARFCIEPRAVEWRRSLHRKPAAQDAVPFQIGNRFVDAVGTRIGKAAALKVRAAYLSRSGKGGGAHGK